MYIISLLNINLRIKKAAFATFEMIEFTLVFVE